MCALVLFFIFVLIFYFAFSLIDLVGVDNSLILMGMGALLILCLHVLITTGYGI